MVILEAMSCAVPVVSTRSGGPDGVNLMCMETQPAPGDRSPVGRRLRDKTLNLLVWYGKTVTRSRVRAATGQKRKPIQGKI
jgi:hypothetical protein